MFPYRDENETRRTAVVTIGIIVLCTLVWLIAERAGSFYGVNAATCNYGLIPGELTQSLKPGDGFPMGHGLACIIDPGPQYENLFTSMFLHGSWMHLIGNMWFLWIFGNNIEDSMTRPRFVVFYLVCGLAAALAQVLSQPASAIPMVGASGAISGVMGAYVLLYPRVRVWTFLGFFFVPIPAWAMLIWWMLAQVVGGVTQDGTTGGTAFWAHVGGFLAGILLIKLFVVPGHVAARGSTLYEPDRVGWR